MTTPRVLVMRGIPGSGKTTRALEAVANSNGEAFRLNRDDFRSMLFGHDGSGGGRRPSKAQERAALAARDGALRALLDAGHVVILDDTNLRPDDALRSQVQQATWANVSPAQVEIIDVDTPVEECIRRDLRRARSVGEKVIRDMARKRDEVLGLIPPPPAVDPSLPWAILVDIDGTLAHMQGRSPFAWDRVGEDRVDETIRGIVAQQNDRVICMSGRDGSCFEETHRWLREHEVPFSELLMREAGDMRPDDIVKAELYDQHIAGRFNVRFVLDDRDRVVAMWRRRGLKCLQVAPGAF